MLPANYVCTLPVSELLDQINNHHECFGVHTYRKDLYIHNAMTDIWVRYNHISNLGSGFNDEHDSVWYPEAALIPAAMKLCFMLMAIVNGERLGGVLITKIPAGGKIERHIDSGWHAEYYQKYYVPIKNEKGARFCWDSLEIEPNAGEVWRFDNSVPHWVNNDSNEDRIAMIVCIRTLEQSING
jgi:hypothetical protein